MPVIPMNLTTRRFNNSGDRYVGRRRARDIFNRSTSRLLHRPIDGGRLALSLKSSTRYRDARVHGFCRRPHDKDQPRAVEMPGLWKAWKANNRLPPLSTSPLGISPQSRRDSHIPTAPAARPGGKVENQKQVSHFPTAPILISLNQSRATARLSPPSSVALCADSPTTSTNSVTFSREATRYLAALAP
jgi:hypothetical protein